tara:strand:- start:1300 stop:1464 length:165 start_codon:yes stop_codon:yes gene_type:complete
MSMMILKVLFAAIFLFLGMAMSEIISSGNTSAIYSNLAAIVAMIGWSHCLFNAN